MRIFFHNRYKPKDKAELMQLLENLSINLWEIDTSLITDMRGLFLDSKRKGKDFEGIETWDVSNVTDMSYMFYNCKNFNRSLNDWDVSNVKNMSHMFYNCYKFNQPLDKWDASNVNLADFMFRDCHALDQPVDKWSISKIKNRKAMFLN